MQGYKSLLTTGSPIEDFCMTFEQLLETPVSLRIHTGHKNVRKITDTAYDFQLNMRIMQSKLVTLHV